MPLLVVLGVLAAGVALAVVIPRLQAEQAKSDNAAACREIEMALNASAVQGGDPVRRAQLEGAHRACIDDLRAKGVDIDTSVTTLVQLRAIAQQMAQEWGHYKSTDYADTAKRSNTRKQILRSGDEIVRKLREAVGEAQSIESLEALRAFAVQQASESFNRAACFDLGASGCGRFGTSEPPWWSTARDEWTRILYPLIGVQPDRPEERRAIYLRAVPRFDRIGVAADYTPRFARRGYEYGGIRVEDAMAFRAAATNDVISAIDAKIAELRARPATDFSGSIAGTAARSGILGAARLNLSKSRI
jgi:hypothetical protein